MKVRIVQLLCPLRHCVVALAYQTSDGAEQPQMAARMMEGFADSGANPWCGLCHSRNLNPEDRPTMFATMEDAAPYLAVYAARQAETRAYLKASKG